MPVDPLFYTRSKHVPKTPNHKLLVLNIEIQAYDLYRNMANILTEAAEQEAFLSISQMEKKHMELLAKVFKECAD